MRSPTWWQFGLLGAGVLAVATIVKVLKSLWRLVGENADTSWTEWLVFAAWIPTVGFVCGVLVWLLLPLSRQFGAVGDAILGISVMEMFFLLCMFTFDDSLISSRGLPMFGFAAVTGIFLGVSVGKEMRKYLDKNK